MKFTIKVGELVEQISQAAITTDPKSLDQPNSKVYLRAAKKNDVGVVYYYSTNQMTRTFLKSEVEVEEPGEMLVDATSMLGGLQGRDPDLECNVSIQPDKKIRIKIGRNKFDLKHYPAAERLAKEVDLLPFKVEPMAKISGQLLLEFIKRTLFCIPASGNGQQRFAMDVLHLQAAGGQYIGQATDGGIISLNYGSQPEEKDGQFDVASMLIAQEALAPLQKLLGKRKDEEVGLVNPSQGNLQELFFRMNGVLFGCNLRTGKFPKLKTVVDQHVPDYQFMVQREELKAALMRASNFVSDGSRSVQLKVEKDTSLKVLAANDSNDIDDEVDGTVTSGDFVKVKTTVGLDYLANLVSVMTGETIALGLSELTSKALVVTGDTQTEEGALLIGSTYAIMPVTPQTKSATK